VILNFYYILLCSFLVLSVELPIEYAVIELCRYIVAWIGEYAHARIGGYRARIFAVMGYVASWCPATRHLAAGCFHILYR